MEHSPKSWYIVQSASGQCKILCQSTGESLDEAALASSVALGNPFSEDALTDQWGPFKTQNQAIAKRVGLIRSGKCKPS